MKRVLVVLALVVLAGAPQAFANSASDVIDKWMPDGPGVGEINLYDIVNQVYANAGGTGANGVWNQFEALATVIADGDLEHSWELGGLEPSQDDFFSMIKGDTIGTVARARYAGYDQDFGWYDQTDSQPPTLHSMFSVSAHNNDVYDNAEALSYGYYWTGAGDAAFSALLAAGTVSDPFDFGLYDDAPIGIGLVEYSEEWRNAPTVGATDDDHMLTFLVDQRADATDPDLTQYTFILAWEDLQLGDIDFNDLVVEMVITSAGEPYNPVPEPSTLALLSLGVVGVLLRKRFVV